jgi:glutathione peroxidase-family protein
LYSKYKDRGFEIIGVSDDDSNHDAWHKAVEKDGLPWRHVLRGFDRQKLMKNEPNEKDISEKYGIHSLPTKILIDPNGVIIGRYDEQENALDEKLKEVFK